MRLRKALGRTELALMNLVALAAIAAYSLNWIPVFEYGRSSIEIPNTISIAMAAIFPFMFLRYRPHFEVSLIYLILMGWCAICAGIMVISNSPKGMEIPIQVSMALIFGWGISILIARGTLPVRRIAFFGNAVLIGMIIVSASLTGRNFFIAFISGLSGRRWDLLTKVLKPMLNAFSSNFADLIYKTTLINIIAATLVVFSILSFYRKNESDEITIPEFSLAMMAITISFLIFSSSSLIVIAVFVLLKVIQITFTYKPVYRFAIIIASGFALIAACNYVFEYASNNIATDEKTRSVRINQYEYALSLINENPIFGFGYVKIDGLNIHNFLLFSWVTGGISLLILALLFYLFFAKTVINLIQMDRLNFPIYVALGALVLVRTLVGGGGGAPNSSVVLPLALIIGLLARKNAELARTRRELQTRTARGLPARPSPIAAGLPN
jgi:O-antigen ligase